MSVPGTDDFTDGEYPDDLVTPVPRDPGKPPDRADPDASEAPVVRLLAPDGRRLSNPTYDPLLADLTGADLLGLLRDMVIARRIDEEATALQRRGELGLWTSLRGQEAAQVGSARALRADDMVFPSYREHGAAWCRGVDLVDVLGLFRGVSHGGWDAAEHGFQAYALVVGSQVLHATGYAMGVGREYAVRGGAAAGGGGEHGDPPATVVYFGDGASSQGDVNEAFNWAGVLAAPVVFFCQNNHWAISAPIRRQTRVPIYRRAHAFGLRGVRVDGNDVLATLAVTRQALQAARKGHPTLIEAVTYRMGAHTTADDPSRYRDPDEVARWSRRDSIQRMAAHLRHRGLFDDRAAADLDAEADALAAALRRRCLDLPDPSPITLFDHVYVDDTDVLAAARAAVADVWSRPTAPAPGNRPVPPSPPEGSVHTTTDSGSGRTVR
ncbi:3-methyl-2-oxobutanoate dehydrogenase [Candidatus Protofrankia californiensis]|uniref:2-oxoisovalerate dehydrogenase subunit alpha n=1 Tax=Candidatus Protofrankia californiensis TaxID=1839754 RepID=A0A1C3PHH1_9ACTN|nr:3-methyl-2-oxobutanoate dehydrogenase [Candidatus Protofrankia californiensis]